MYDVLEVSSCTVLGGDVDLCLDTKANASSSLQHKHRTEVANCEPRTLLATGHKYN